MAARKPASDVTDRQAIENLEHTVRALVGQVVAAMETLAVMRAEQMRMMEHLGLGDAGMRAPHLCSDPGHDHGEPPHRKATTVELKGRRKKRGRHGR